ncbi:MAG: hypothetical protein WC107_04970 [Patescibacteria group bacterium]
MKYLLVLVLILSTLSSLAAENTISFHCAVNDLALWQEAGRTKSTYWLKGLTQTNATDFAKKALDQASWIIERIKADDPDLLENYVKAEVNVAEMTALLQISGMNLAPRLKCYQAGEIKLREGNGRVLKITFHDGAFRDSFYAAKDFVALPGMEKSSCYALLALHEMIHVKRTNREARAATYPDEEVATDSEIFALLEKRSKGKFSEAIGFSAKMTSDAFDKDSITTSFNSLSLAEMAIFGERVPRNLTGNALTFIALALAEERGRLLGLSAEETHKMCVAVLQILDPQWAGVAEPDK